MLDGVVGHRRHQIGGVGLSHPIEYVSDTTLDILPLRLLLPQLVQKPH